MPASVPPLDSVVETGLYVADTARSRRFYEDILGLKPMFHDERLTAYPVGKSVLLLFRQGTTDTPARLPTGVIPPHDGSGRLHYAFAIPAAALEPWRARLLEHEVNIEGEVTWPKGGHSLYFRDPDEHLLELVTPGIWENY